MAQRIKVCMICGHAHILGSSSTRSINTCFCATLYGQRADHSGFNIGIAGSSPSKCMDACVRLFCVYVVLCIGSGLSTA
jgi:hypothetical protein